MFRSAPAAEAEVQWSSTDDAARHLLIHSNTLRRWANEPELGFVAGLHYKKGPHKRSRIYWNVEAIENLINGARNATPSEAEGMEQ